MAGTQQTSQGATAAEPELRTVALDDKYDLSKQQIFLTGTQALVRHAAHAA
jgi:indolepyruvate ferredoxin oxidoreductase